MRSRFFKIEELFSRQFLETLVRGYGRTRAEAVCWGLLDDRLLAAADQCRIRYGKATVNTWPFGGDLQQCGFRSWNALTGSHYSGHKYGRAFDLHFTGWDYEDIRQDLKARPIAGITEIELDTPSWLHIGTRNHNFEGILWLPKP